MQRSAAPDAGRSVCCLGRHVDSSAISHLRCNNGGDDDDSYHDDVGQMR